MGQNADIKTTSALPYIDSYYSRTMEIETDFPKLTETVKTPVCIIGGGMAGVAAAQSLAERNIKSVLVEAHKIAWGASGRNGGFVSPGYSLSPQKIAKKVGEKHARALNDLTIDAYNLVKKRMGKNADIIRRPSEGLVGVSWFNDQKSTQDHVSFMNNVMGVEFKYWDKKKVSEHYASKKYYDAFFNPLSMSVHSLDYTRHAANTIQGNGGEIYEKSPVVQLVKKDNLWHVTTEKGLVIADQVILCCGVQSENIQKKLSRSVLSVSTFVMLTEPIEDKMKKIINAPYNVADNRFSSNYYRPLKDGRLLWGGLVSMFNPSQQRLKKIMMRNLLNVYPDLKGIKADVAWGGNMGYPAHKMPQIGKMENGLWYAQGFGGHGMTSTVAAGEVVASAIAENDETYKLFEPFGLQYVGGAFGPIIAQSAYWFFQFQDAVRVFRQNR